MSVQAERPALTAMGRAQLHAATQRYFKQAGPTEPDVALVVSGDATAVFKDYGRRSGWFVRLVAPVLIWREASALRALEGLAGVPALIRQVDARGLLLEYCPAEPWARCEPPDSAYPRLAALVTAIHERGIAHGDLRGGGNFLMDDQGRPYVVDFVARVRRGSGWNVPWNWLFRRFCAADRGALIKLRMRHAPHLVTVAERASAAERGPVERMARALGESVRRLTRHFAARD